MEKGKHMNKSYNGNIPDLKIWKLLKEGRREALRILFLNYYQDLYVYAYKLSGDTFLAKDCIHELFYRIWDRREHLGDIKSAKSYLWISLRRDVIKEMKKRDHEILSSDFFSHSKMLTFTSEDFIIHKEKQEAQKKALLEALDELSDRHREAIVLKFFNGMEYEEIQTIMSVNYQTARNYIYHGVKALKEQFGDRVFVQASL